MKLIITCDDEYSYPLHMQGSVSVLPMEAENETLKRLHEVVAEITNKPVPSVIKPRMGFLP